MKIVVFCPTNRYGFDVFVGSIKRQTRKPDLIIVGDELLDDRYHHWATQLTDYSRILFKPIPHEPRNLVSAYNTAVDLAIERGYGDGDLFISLQDYIWIEENGIAKMEDINLTRPDDLITGTTHISVDPFPNRIINHKGLQTIFKESYYDMPKRIQWEDVRSKMLYQGYPKGAVLEVDPEHWEANWAAVPFKYFIDGLRWNTEYDNGYAYENIDFALQAIKKYNCTVLMDTGNVAISLPHRDYFEGEAEDLIKYNNREFHESLWSI